MEVEPRTLHIGPSDVVVRAAEASDLEALNDLYNEYVRTTHITFDLEPMTVEARHEWFGHYDTSGRHRLLVADSAGSLIGYAASSRFRPKPGYDTSVETSIYLSPEATGRGVGTRLYESLFAALRGQDIHRAYAGIALPNPASVALHERFGFKRVALFTEQGRKFNRYWDVAWYEKAFGAT